MANESFALSEATLNMTASLLALKRKAISSVVCIGGVVAMLCISAALDTSSVGAQEATAPAPANAPAGTPAAPARGPAPLGNGQPLPAPAKTPAGYRQPPPADRFQELEQTIAQQQRQIEAQQAQLNRVAAQVQASGAPTGQGDATNADPAGANANRSSATFASMIQGPGREPSIYPGSAAPVPSSATGIGGYEVGSDKSFQGYWGPDGPIWRTKNGDFSFHPRAVAQLDFVAMRNPPNNIVVPGGSGTLDSVEFRRLRMGADGTMWDIIDYVFEFDFALALQNVDPANTASPVTGLRSIGTVGGVPQTQAGNTAGVMQTSTTFLVFKQLPMFDNIRVGNQQSWLSLEHIESARFLDFMERSPIMDAFNGPNNNGYTPGISTYRTFLDMNVGLQLGVYKNNNYDSGFTYDIGNTNYSYGGRLICTPYYDLPSKGRYMVHLGIGGEWRTMQQQPTPNMDGTNIRIRSRGDIRTTASTLDPNFSDTGNFYANAQGLINPELAVVWGPWLLQAEWEDCIMQGAAVQKGGKSLGNVNFNGGYVALLYFLTGENREYNRVSGVFNRVVPYSNASWTRGGGFQRGAWQVGLRYDWLDLNSGAVSGGQNQDLTVGVNWFLNPNARFQFNYVASWINNAPGVTFPGTVGSLNGSRFVGEGVINTLGCRMDFNW